MKKNEKILAAREYIIQGYSNKIVSMFTGLKLTKINSIKKKMKLGRKVLDLPKGGKNKLSRQHLSWFYDIFQIKRYNLMNMKEIREKFFERFNLVNSSPCRVLEKPYEEG